MGPSKLAPTGLLTSFLLVLAGLTYAGAGVGSAAPAPPDPSKLDSGLKLLAANAAAGRPATAPAAASPSGLSQASGAQVVDGKVLVDVYVDGSLASADGELAELGMDTSATSATPAQHMVEGWLPVDSLLDATAAPGTRAIVLVPAEDTNEGSVLSEGDTPHHGPQARALGSTGAGVKVGVISNSINRAGGGVASSQGTGDLPGPASVPAGSVTVLQDGTAGSNDEGRAMAEIIYDTAPGVRQMYFTTGQGAATRASGIANLVANGVKVIADDTFQITEPFFQDGVVAQAVDAAKAAGVTYLVSAGNRARQSWEGTYAPTTDPRAVSPSANDFDPSAGADAIQTIGTFTNRTIFVSFQWAERWGAAQTDLALDVWAISGGVPTYAFSADTNNIVGGLPSEFTNIAVTGTVTVGVSVRRVAGTGTPFMKYIVGNAPVLTIAEYPTNSAAIDPDASSARGALTVAASAFGTPTTPENFSSRGPAVTRFFGPTGTPLATPEVRPKPDLAAADGVATSVSGFAPFFGTSAAAPSAAGVAALIRSANPGLSVDGVAAILKDPAYALDCTATAGQPDGDCGSGFILADKMVAAAKDTSPPSVTGTATPAAGPGGWYSGNVTVAWAVADADSPVYATSGCSAVTFASTGVANCSAASAGGTTAKSLSIRIDRTAPAKLKAKGLKKTYAHGTKPAKKKVKCGAKDPESGLSSCKLKGLKTTPGTHKVTVVATNGAGLVSKKKFSYTIL